MKYFLLALALAAVVPAIAHADQYVRGYVRGDGTVVSPYIRSTPNGTTLDNYGGR